MPVVLVWEALRMRVEFPAYHELEYVLPAFAGEERNESGTLVKVREFPTPFHVWEQPDEVAQLIERAKCGETVRLYVVEREILARRNAAAKAER